MKIKVDQEMVDKIIVRELASQINTLVDHIIDLLNKKSLQQYEIEDLRNDRQYLRALVLAYEYNTYDPGRWDEIMQECLG